MKTRSLYTTAEKTEQIQMLSDLIDKATDPRQVEAYHEAIIRVINCPYVVEETE